VPTSIYNLDMNSVGLWHFNEAGGLKAYDATRNHNDGDLIGSPLAVPGPDLEVAVDRTPPSAPSNITVFNTGTGGKLNLSWTNPKDIDFDHLRIYRSTAPGLLGDLIFDKVSGTAITDNTVSDGQTYYYTLRAVDFEGNESTNKEQYSGTSEVLNNAGLSFDPVDDYVLVPYNSSLNISGAMTVEAFVKVRSFSGNHGVIASRWDGNTISWELYYENSGKLYFYVTKPDKSGYFQAITAPGVLTTGSWFHVAGVLNPVTDELSVYFNGRRVASRTYFETGAYASTARLGINAAPNGTMVGDATMDEVRISNSARYTGSTYQVPTSIYNLDMNSVGLWHFNEAGGLKAYDFSSNQNNGNLMGDPLRVPGYSF